MKPTAWLAGAALAFVVPSANAATFEYSSSDVPKAIAADRSVTFFSNLEVPDAFVIDSLTVRLTIQHVWVEDIDLFLFGPTGLAVELSSHNGGSGDNYVNTVFDDAALASIADCPTVATCAPFTGSYRPEGLLASFAGTPALGLWRLRVHDDAAGFGGSLQSYALLLASLGLFGFLRGRRAGS